MKKIFVLLPLLAGLLNLNAQMPSYCGTLQTEEDLVWLRNHQQNYVPGEGDRGGTTYYIPTKVHIVGNDEGTGYYNLTHLYTQFCELNEHFAATGFVFYIYGDLDYIDNTDYYIHDWMDGSEMMDDNNVNDVLNVYFVADPAGNCGYFSPSDNGVAVAKSCAMPEGTTIAHEFGHFFSLPHTFYGWEWGTPDDSDQEWVNGDNCNSAADGFCDTPSDYLPYRWNCPGPLQTDPFGETFYSDGTFYMSYSNDACTDKFSNEQQDAMIANLLGPRNNMLDFEPPVYVDVTTVPELVTPADLATGMYPNYTYVEWTATPGATQYHLQLAYSSSFSAIAFDIVTENNYYELTELLGDKKYYWRVRPLAPLNTCEPASLARSFTTGNSLSAIADTDLFEHLSLFPNPTTAENGITLNYRSASSFNGTLSVLDITGKIISEQQVNIVAGSKTLSIDLPAVAEGIYFIKMTNATQSELIEFMIAE
jgi:hypothetical protein